MKLWCN